MSDDQKQVVGVTTNDFGIAKDLSQKDTYQAGVNIRAKFTILSEGAKGSLSEKVINEFDLASEISPQIYGLGFKEVWEIDQDALSEWGIGDVMHTVGFPTSQEAYAGGFLYTMAPNLVHIGYIVGLDYKNPNLNLYQEFQLFKNHPKIRNLLEKGKCLKYGARVINEGGHYAIPKLTFPGGALIGCSAGFVNVAKIKGTHNAMKTGMLAAEGIIQKIETNSGIDNVQFGEELFEYSNLYNSSWVHEEMYKTRNIKGSFSKGLLAGMIRSFLILTLSKGKETFQSLPKGRDSASMDDIDK